ncbi:MAG: right-handed parallel beta-helix repeat-containing protein [Actinomycetota bacterium]|nr:right-handed parallel beta-helix repeat-containing protein [Actinomycetota bacterium]
MMGRRAFRGLWAAAACAAALLGLASSAGGATRDDSAWLQAKLDAGGTIFLPRLPSGQCYATRGLWVSRDDTTVTSDGACIVALGPGEGRIPRGDGTFVAANAVFFVDHSDVRKPLPVRIAISGLHITVPAGKRMHGISVLGHEVTLTSLTIDGSPLTDVRIGAGTKGSGGMSSRIAVTNSTLSGGVRDVVSIFGPVGFRVEGNVLSGARGKTAAGLHIRAADRGQPTLDVRVAGNKLAANSGPGILLDLAPANGLPVLASGIEIARNEIVGNARKAPKERRAGIVLAGGQNDGKGQILIRENLFRGNRGPDLLRRRGPAATITGGPKSVPPLSTAPVRDDTAWLQSRLDRAGGTIFLPKLRDSGCYATRGLWVSHDGTTITSDGACIVSLGLGPVRLHSIDGDPIAASAVFFVNRSTPTKPAPVHVTISNLRIVVPEGQSMYGVAVFGHKITLSHLDIGGSPKDDVTISGRANGNSYAGSISILDSTLSGANRNAISATAVIGLRIVRNTIVGVRDSPPGQPAAGIDIEPDDRGQPALDVRIIGNTIIDNAGPGILLELEPNDGPAVIATELEISGNIILRNAAKRTPPKRGGIVLAGGQDGGQGTLVLKDNVIRGNGGPGILKSRLRLLLDSAGNDVSGNETA